MSVSPSVVLRSQYKYPPKPETLDSPRAYITGAWILGTEPLASGRVVYSLNCCTVSPAPKSRCPQPDVYS